MKATAFKFPVWISFIVLFAQVFDNVAASDQRLDWSTIDGGGGTSTGGVYSVSGTIGQPEAGRLSGGNYTLQGGFWGAIAAVQTPGAPLLSISIHHHRLLARAVVIPAEHGFSGALSKQANL